MDAINHIDKIILSLKDDLKDSTEQDEELPALCHQDELMDYEEQAWGLGVAVREKMLTVMYQHKFT